MAKFKIRHTLEGKHVHARVFVTSSRTFAYSGTLVFEKNEWQAFADMLRIFGVEFVDDGTDVPKAPAEIAELAAQAAPKPRPAPDDNPGGWSFGEDKHGL